MKIDVWKSLLGYISSFIILTLVYFFLQKLKVSITATLVIEICSVACGITIPYISHRGKLKEQRFKTIESMITKKMDIAVYEPKINENTEEIKEIKRDKIGQVQFKAEWYSMKEMMESIDKKLNILIANSK